MAMHIHPADPNWQTQPYQTGIDFFNPYQAGIPDSLIMGRGQMAQRRKLVVVAIFAPILSNNRKHAKGLDPPRFKA